MNGKKVGRSPINTTPEQKGAELMELERPNTSSQVNEQVHYARGAYYVLDADRMLVRVPRHMARVRLISRFGFSRAAAEAKLNEIRDHYVSHPDQAFEIKRRHVRDSTNIPLTEAELTEVASHGWRKYREAAGRRWRNPTEVA